MTVPDVVRELVERFDHNREAYLSVHYNETETRREFLDPLFKALGWDIDNERGYAEPYKDVVHEDAIRIAGGLKAPDYSFRVGGTRRFFVEAKKPSLRIRDHHDSAYQLRTYAWSARLPLSILTNFDCLSVYDARIKPKAKDKPSAARIDMFGYRDYLARWDDLAGVFSRDAVLKGSFDKYALTAEGKKGTTEVDADFLKEIEKWRAKLAKNLAENNPLLSESQLNFAVQRTIDRIIFLRICEDRGIEQFGKLLQLRNWTVTYKRLCDMFIAADKRYNSGLFYFHSEKNRYEQPDELTLNLEVGEEPLQHIIRSIYYPSPYVFAVFPPEILGQVYEQFLGKVIRLTPTHSAKVEDKPEVKKAGGVFYTPAYVVDYIVKNTVGKLLEGRTPKDAVKLRVLDPACGSGSFLIAAYQYLLDWYLDRYTENEAARRYKTEVFQTRDNEWRLTTAERKRILLNSIYGVDVDPQAVEVTKLSLLLKVLEGESGEALTKAYLALGERALPDLGKNIRCGNSLVSTDFIVSKQADSLTQEELQRINSFDWNAGFPEIMRAGGFDAVIGNPPYVRQEGLGAAKAYFESHYKTFTPTADLYVNFIEKGLGLLRQTGLFGMIVSNKWLRAAYGRPLREFLARDVSVLQIVDLAGLPVFSNATVRTIIIICAPVANGASTIGYLPPMESEDFYTVTSGSRLQELVDKGHLNLDRQTLYASGWSLAATETSSIVEKMRSGTIRLTEYLDGKVYFGVKTGCNEAFIIDAQKRDALVNKDPRSAEIVRPLLAGRDVRRYGVSFKDRYLLWTYIGVPIDRYPAVFKHLKRFKSRLEKRWDKGNHWWELRACDYYDRFSQPKIMYPDISTSCRFALDREGYFGSNTTYFMPVDDLYLLGILNSALGQFYFSQVCAGLEGKRETYLRFFGQYMEGFPIVPERRRNGGKRSRHGRIVALVEKMLDLQERLAVAKTGQEKTALERQITATDDEIDRLVYDLYGLTEEEIQIVGGGTR